MQDVDLSVVIVNWNSYDLVVECVHSLSATVGGARYEVIVVDNSQDESGRKQLLRELGPDVKVLPNSSNLGFAAANNQALRLARGAYFLLLNPDAVALVGSIDEMIGLLERHGDIGILGCQLINADGTTQTSAYSLYPSILAAAADVTGLLTLWRKVTNLLPVSSSSRPYRRVAWVKGACLMTRSRVVAEIGLLDEAFFLYSEDADWCKRARDAGWTVASTQRGRVLHRGQRSAGRVPDASIRAYYDSYLKFVVKHGGGRGYRTRVAFLAVLLRLSALVRMVAIAVGGRRPTARARALAYWRFLIGEGSKPLEVGGLR